MSDFMDHEANLHGFVESVKKQAREKQFGIVMVVSSSTHTEYVLEPFPKWSCVQFIEGADGTAEGVHIKAKAGRDDERLASSMHVLLSLRDMIARCAAYLIETAEMTTKRLSAHGAEVEHHPFGGERTEVEQ